MKVLFIVAKTYAVEPFGVMQLTPMLRRDGHEVGLVEAEAPDLAVRVAGFAPAVVGYSVCTGAHSYYLALNRYLKSRCRFISVFGGPHPTFFPEMIEEEGVDAICRGEGELAMAEFCRELERTGTPVAVGSFTVKHGGQVSTGAVRPLVQNLDELPFPDRELYYGLSAEVAGYGVRSFLAARGCPFGCTYCFNKPMDELYEGAWKRVRVRSVQNLLAEIVQVAGRYRTEFVAFRESIFPLQREWLSEFAREYPRRVGLPFYCHLRLDLLNENNVQQLATAGCYSVNVGIETGNERLRAELLDRPMSNARIIAACRLLRQHGIKVFANNMLGLPGATFAHDLETLALNQQCAPDYALATLWQPYPRTALTGYARHHGHFDGNYDAVQFTYYATSPLRFRSEQEKRRIENLQKLFAIATGLPILTPLLKWLTRLPPNPVFRTIFRTYYFVTHQTEIFRHRTTANDWWSSLRHITREA